MVAGDDACNEAEKTVCICNVILVGVDQTRAIGDLMDELGALLNANDRALGCIHGGVCHFYKSLGLSGTLQTNKNFNHN